MNDPPNRTQDRTELDDVAARLRDLPAEIPPARDLWPAIAERTVGAARTVDAERTVAVDRARPRRFFSRPALALAASLALAFAGGWLVARSRPVPTPPPTVLPATVFVAPAAYRETDAALTAVRDTLRREVEAKGAHLPPELARLVAENLATIDRAITEIEAALAAEPGNGELARAWVDYRQREISLLRRVNQAAARL